MHVAPAALARLRCALPSIVQADWLAECASTNTELKHRITSASEEACALLLGTELQTSGRGTRGREWRQGGPGQDIALSLAFRLASLPGGCPALDPRAPLAVGVLAARAIEPAGLGVRLKWPNDLLVGTPPAKVGGILCELSGGWLITGVGINVNSLPGDFPGLAPATLRQAAGRLIDRELLALRLAAGLLQLAWLDPDAPRPSAGELLAEWLKRDVTGGQRYRLARGEGILVTARGVDLATGGLKCEDDAGAPYLVRGYSELQALPG